MAPIRGQQEATGAGRGQDTFSPGARGGSAARPTPLEDFSLHIVREQITVNSCCLKPPSVWYFSMVALGKESTPCISEGLLGRGSLSLASGWEAGQEEPRAQPARRACRSPSRAEILAAWTLGGPSRGQ